MAHCPASLTVNRVTTRNTSEASPLTAESVAGVVGRVRAMVVCGDRDGERSARGPCWPRPRVDGPDLSERLCAELAGRRPGGVVHDRASGLPHPVPGDHG